MKMYLFYVAGIAGLEDWLDRELVFKIHKFEETDTSLVLEVDEEDKQSLNKLNPNKNYAVQFEYVGGDKELKYYYVRAFEITLPEKGETKYSVNLMVKKLTV